MCPGAGDYAAQHVARAESGNEPAYSNDIELDYFGLTYACSGRDSDSAERQQRSTGTDSNRTLHSCSREQWRAVADVANALMI